MRRVWSRPLRLTRRTRLAVLVGEHPPAVDLLLIDPAAAMEGLLDLRRLHRGVPRDHGQLERRLMVLQGIPARSLNGSPHRGLPCRAAENRLRDASDIKRRTPVTVTVLPQVEIVADAMQPDCQQADTVPAVKPAMDERQLRRISLDQHSSKCGSESASGGLHCSCPSRGGAGSGSGNGASGNPWAERGSITCLN
jgi:hypothetical protein